MGFELRPYQTAAVEGLRKALRTGLRRVILSSPTGSGKTEMGFEIIRGAQEKGQKVAFIANRIQLIEQTCHRLDRAGFNYGVIQGANTRDPWQSILVCSIDSIKTRGLPEDIKLFVIDEAHACAGTLAYREIMAGKYCIGLTATPYTKGLGKHYDSLGGNLFERVVTAARIEDLIRDGYLVSADIWAPSEPDLSKVKVTSGEYDKKQLGEAVDKTHLIGDIVAHWFKIANNTPTVVFATNISHSKHIVEQFKAAGVAAEHLDHWAKDEERQAVMARVVSGETMVISNVGILAEGWDFPACKTLILARPTKSLVRYLQMAGRVLRPFPGKDRAIILDHSGVVRRLGFPWDYFGQHLDDGKPKESDGSVPEKPEPLPKPCPQCHFMKPPKTAKCPACGFEAMRPDGVTVDDGELVPVTKEVRGIPALKTLGRETILAQLRGYQLAHSYSDGWTKHKYKTIFDCWPRSIQIDPVPPEGVVLSWLRSEQIKWAKSKNTRTFTKPDQDGFIVDHSAPEIIP